MNIKQHKFVTEYLRNGDAMVAYWRAYNVKDPNGRAVESAANRLLRHPEIKAAIDESQSRIRNEVEREVAARRVEEVFSIEEKRVLLKKIATGQMMVEQYYKGKDCNMCTQYVRPTIWHILSALKEDSRLAGHYPQQKTTEPSKRVIPAGIDVNKAATGTCPPLAGVSRSDGGGTLAQDTQHLDETSSLSPLKEISIRQQPSEADSLRHLERHESPQQNTTTDGEFSPLGAGGDTSPDTITHDELMKLLYPNRHKAKQHY